MVIVAVYETSLYLSILFGCSVAQDMPTAILSHLQNMYNSNASCMSTSTTTTTTIHLLHLLLMGYPSQQAYFDRLKTLTSRSNTTQEGAPSSWIRALARALLRYDFITFDVLSQVDAFERSHSCPPSCGSTTTGRSIAMGPFDDLSKAAVSTLLARLRSKARGTAWSVMKGAYRVVSVSDQKEEWVGRYLVLDGASRADVETWMEERSRVGDAILERGGWWKIGRGRR